ncbi:MAG TPA: PEP-utilizing enzyme [Casimicrobiaceae bacterium]
MNDLNDGSGALPFEAPSPGAWMLDGTHFTRPATRFVAELFPEPFRQGFGESLKRYGSLLEYLDWAFVNGCPYFCPRPIGAPSGAAGPPPRATWNTLVETNAEIRARFAASAKAFECKLWREDLKRWDGELKPQVIASQKEIQAVDPDRFPTAALLAHLDRAREHARKQLYLHHLLNMPAMLPVGDFLAHAQEWTGCPAHELLALLRGASPVSLGAQRELLAATEAISADASSRALLFSAAQPADVLAALRERPGSVGETVCAYVGLVGYRLVNGEDIGEPYALELPEVLVKTLRCAANRAAADQERDETAGRIAAIRDLVPFAQRADFDALLSEARMMHRLRDERGIFCDLWAYGILRRAILAAGRRLADRGRITDPIHLVEADYQEMRALIRDGDGPAADELAGRAMRRARTNYADVPAHLGSAPGQPLPADWLPPAATRMERAMGTYIQALFFAPQARSEAHKVRGLPVSSGIYEGSARVLFGTQEFARLRQGDVLVTGSTTAAFNVVLPLLGAIVTDRGGLLSHAAIVAREYGIPAVVGCTDATRRIPDGVRLRVDGIVGEVTLLS